MLLRSRCRIGGINAVLGDVFKKTKLPGVLERACTRDPKLMVRGLRCVHACLVGLRLSVLSCHLRSLFKMQVPVVGMKP